MLLTKENIVLMLAEKKGYIQIDQDERRESEVWKIFGKVFKKSLCADEQDERIHEWIACIKCDQLFGSKTSTGTLGRHKCIKLNDNPIQRQITPYFQKKDISKEHFRMITEGLVNFVAEDMRPFTAVEGSGFMKFCHTLVNIQNKYASPIDISNNLPGREAVRSGVKRRASSVRDQITEQIKLVYNRDRTLNFTTDLWTCDYTKNSYIDISWHYLESKEEMSSFAIGTIPFGYESHTAINIESKIKEVFEQYGISSELLFQSSFSTSDCARNISLALYNISYPTQCANHRLSTSLQTAWDRTTLKCLEARNLMDDCTELVRFMKQSALYYQKMTKKLKKYCTTRWNSRYIMMNSILQSHSDIQVILSGSGHFNKIATINEEDLSSVVTFLEFFYKLTKILEASNSPTQHKIVPCLAAIKKHCELTRTNSIVSEYADQTIVQIKTKFITDSEACPLKYLACFLNPKTKSMDTVVWNEDMKWNIMNDEKVTEFFELMCPKIIQEFATNSTSITSDNEVVYPHTKVDDPLKEFDDIFEITQGDGKKLLLKEQIKEYINMPIDTVIWDYSNPLTFWNTCITERLQLLSILARAILSVPATCVYSFLTSWVITDWSLIV